MTTKSAPLAAAVFEFPVLREFAGALERAAAAAVSESAPISELLTLKAIRLRAASPQAAN